MIKLNNVNKYYYKGEQREIHVVNDVSLELSDYGFVSILGPSGSGKTTLLNIIGGLDNYYNGNIDYNGKIFKKYSPKEIDLLRSQDIGYVFQNYLLFPNYTVYDNLRIALEIIDIYDPDEQKKRIDYALQSVGMYKYHKKKVKHLSGGQMQRVSIARALCKKTKVIIADEPTGNIDSDNTLEVMNILKKLSQNTLVVLVTHEEMLAYHYADRIIRMQDGKIISDIDNKDKASIVNDKNSNKIYLKDLEKQEYNDEELKLNVYSDHSLNSNVINLIIKNHTIYIESNNNIINTKESSVDLIDDNYQEKIDEVEDNFNFDNSFYQDIKTNSFRFRLKSHLKDAFREVFLSGKKSIILLFIFAFLGGIFAVFSINLAKAFNYNESFVADIKDYYTISTAQDRIDFTNLKTDVLKNAIDSGYIKDLKKVSYFSSTIERKLNFVKRETYSHDCYAIDDKPTNLISGSFELDKIVVGKKLADYIISLDKNHLTNYDNINTYLINDYEISGVSSDNIDGYYYSSLNIDSNYGYNLIIGSKEVENSRYSIIEGRDITNDMEILCELSFAKDNFVSLNSSYSIGNKDYTVVGFISYNDSNYPYNIISTNSDLIGKVAAYNYLYDDFVEIHYLSENDIEVVEGSYPTKDNEILLYVSSKYNIGDDYIYEDYQLKNNSFIVVGKYKPKDKVLSSNLAPDQVAVGCEKILINNYFSRSDYLIFKVNNEETLKNYFSQNDLIFMSHYQMTRYVQQKNNVKNKLNTFIFFVVLLVAFTLYTYFSNRSKLTNEIYYYGVYRCLGKSKRQLYRSNIWYNLVKTTFSSVIGYFVVIIVYTNLQDSLSFIMEELNTGGKIFIYSAWVLLFIFNILFGLLPLNGLIKKTPAQIISKYDM